MATTDDVRDIALALPGVTERSGRGLSEWRVGDKLVVWERPLRKVDLKALGDDAPDGTIIGVRVPDVGAQQALVASGPDAVFITPHFEGWPGVLVHLERIDLEDLRELIVEAWLVQAPKRLTREWLDAEA
jgi:hypothetical protein